MQRLKTRAQFQAVLAGAIIARTAHFALHCTSLNGPDSADKPGAPSALFRQYDMWLGAMVPKRWAKRAVTRNAIKRQIYVVSSEYADSYPRSAFVVRLRCAFAKTEFLSAVSDSLRQAVRTEVQALMKAGAKAA